MLEFRKPNVKSTITSENFSSIEIEPLARGYGLTIGNAIRRVLLSSIPGTAVTKIKLEDNNGLILHEFSSMQGVKEDVCEIILNVKEIVAKLLVETPTTVVIDVVGPCVITDNFISNPDVKILNPSHYIATVDEGAHFYMELTFEHGNGYVPHNKNKENYPNSPIGTIFVDSIFTPVKHVNYKVDSVRVGQNMDYEKLTIDLKTNGGQMPNEAIAYSAGILNCHFNVFNELAEGCFGNINMVGSQEDEKAKKLSIQIEELDLTVRSYNCLKRANVHTVEDLIKKSKSDMRKVRNLGEKSLFEIEQKLVDLGFDFKEEDC